MGGFIVGVGIAAIIFLIVKLGTSFNNKKKNKKASSTAVIEIKENTTDNNEVEKGA